MNKTYLFVLIWIFILFMLLAIYIKAIVKKRNKTTRLQRLRTLKKYYLHELVEDGVDGTEFDCDILNAIEFLEDRYKDE